MDGDAVMDEDTQMFLGAEVVMRLQLTGLRPRSPVERVEGEPARKRAILTRPPPESDMLPWHNPNAVVDVATTAHSDTASRVTRL